MPATLNDVVQFLLGAGELEGCHFGDIPEGERGQYWWRKHLREAFTAAQDTEYLELRRIRTTVAEHYRITPDSLTGLGRSKGIIIARQMAYLLCRELTPCSTTEIGNAFCRDHSTIVVGLETMQRRVNASSELRLHYQHLKSKLEAVGERA